MSMRAREFRDTWFVCAIRLAFLSFALSIGTPSPAASEPKPKTEEAGTTSPDATKSPAGTKPLPGAKNPKLVGFEKLGMPRYAPPASFREDLVITHGGTPMTMRRFVDHGKIRTEMSSEGREFVMVETGDSKGTMYTLMPEQKKAMKQSREATEAAAAKMSDATAKSGVKVPKPDAAGAAEVPSSLQVEDLGDETLDGNAVKKVRMEYGDQDVLGWFEKATGAPVRMESLVDGKKTTLEWKNRKAEPQPAELFEVPKGYEVMDLDDMMSKVGGMGGMGAMGGVGGMAKGMAGGMLQGMGGNIGGSLGGTLGGALGGPLGAAAGQFLGGKIGGMLGKKAASALN